MSVARVVVDSTGILASVFCPFELREIPKAFPGRRWNQRNKCWTLDPRHVDQVADALRAAGCTVYVTNANGTPYGAPRDSGRRYGHRSTPAPNWATALFDALGEAHARKAYRALAHVLHPDVGGDNRLTQQLNDAYSTRKMT